MTDLILINANVITMDSAFPKGHLIVIKNGKIQYVGSNDRLKDLRDSKTNVIDCRNKTILPGFIDAHCHLLGFVESLLTLNLQPRNNVRSIHDIQFKIRQLSQKLSPGTWIRGRGYNDFYLEEKRHPTRWDLDIATPIHPIKLTHRSGHAYVLNSLGLKLANISRETPDPPGGLIDRDIRTGEPTGLLYGMGDYLAKIIPPLDSSQIERGIKLASKKLSSLGITSIYDASPRNNLARWELYGHWKKDGLLKPRVNMTLGLEGFAEYERRRFSREVDKAQLDIKGVKIIVHETTGRLNPSQEELNEAVLHIHQFGLQAVLHAIDEKPIKAACNAIEFALQKFPRQDSRHRIEHCSVCPQPLAKCLASLGIIVVTQPSFIYYNGERYLRTVPNSNMKHIYPIATLLKNGIKVAASSDCPIVPASPMIGIYSAASRMAENGELILPEEKISPLEAIRMYTEDAAKTTFEETTKGSITSGKLADLVVLNGDPTKLPIDEIKDIEVEMTILDGEIVWDKIG